MDTLTWFELKDTAADIERRVMERQQRERKEEAQKEQREKRERREVRMEEKTQSTEDGVVKMGPGTESRDNEIDTEGGGEAGTSKS